MFRAVIGMGIVSASRTHCMFRAVLMFHGSVLLLHGRLQLIRVFLEIVRLVLGLVLELIIYLKGDIKLIIVIFLLLSVILELQN